MRATAILVSLVLTACVPAEPRIEGKVSQEDVHGITAAIRAAATHTHDEIRTIKVIQSSPLTVRVHTASPHNVTEGDYTLRKSGGDWEVSVQREIIH
jgi:hypothetical protein